jgi:hypothetical protein
MNIIKAIGNQQYKSLEKLSHKVIIKKVEAEVDSDYVLERRKYVTKKGAQALGRNYSIIKNCRNLFIDIKASAGLQNSAALEQVIKYAFRINYSSEDISKFLSQYLNSKEEFRGGNINKWFCFIWIHNSDSLLIDWQKNDTYIVKFIDKPKLKTNWTTLVIFRERQSFTNSLSPLSINTFENTVSEEIRKLVIDLIDKKPNNTENVEMRIMLKQKLKEKYPKENFDSYLSRYEYYLLLNKHESKNKILGFTYKQFSILITKHFSSTIREWPEIIALKEGLKFEEREVIDKGLLSQQYFINDATSVKIVSFMETRRKCVIFHNSKINNKFPKGEFDKCFYLKRISCKSDLPIVENNHQNSPKVQNSTEVENNCLIEINDGSHNRIKVDTQPNGICNTEVDNQKESKTMVSNAKTENIESIEPIDYGISNNLDNPIPSTSNSSEVNAAQNLQQNIEKTKSLDLTPTKNKNYVIKYSLLEVSKITAYSNAHIKLVWFEKTNIIANTPRKRNISEKSDNSTKKSITDYFRPTPDKRRRLDFQ